MNVRGFLEQGLNQEKKPYEQKFTNTRKRKMIRIIRNELRRKAF